MTWFRFFNIFLKCKKARYRSITFMWINITYIHQFQLTNCLEEAKEEMMVPTKESDTSRLAVAESSERCFMVAKRFNIDWMDSADEPTWEEATSQDVVSWRMSACEVTRLIFHFNFIYLLLIFYFFYNQLNILLFYISYILIC